MMHHLDIFMSGEKSGIKRVDVMHHLVSYNQHLAQNQFLIMSVLNRCCFCISDYSLIYSSYV